MEIYLATSDWRVAARGQYVALFDKDDLPLFHRVLHITAPLNVVESF